MTVRYGCTVLLLALIASPALADELSEDALRARVQRVLARTPVIDGHNDLAWEIRSRFDGDLTATELADRTKPSLTPYMTDFARLREGGVGAQFWSAWIPATTTGPLAVKMALEQIDLIKRMTAKYPQHLEWAGSSDDIIRIERSGRIASLIGVEGGSMIDDSLAVLRMMQALGVRYLTLTHTLATHWADSATDNPVHHGLTPFGLEVIRELNRLGILVDLSHVSPDVMKAAIEASAAPVIFSHSGARQLADHPRNVPDEVLGLVRENRGIVMQTFDPEYLTVEHIRWDAERAAERARLNAPPRSGVFVGQPERAAAAMAEWERAHPEPVPTIGVVADHIEHIAQIAGEDCVGLGSDFDGIDSTPSGLEGPHRMPAVLIELARRGWSDERLAKLAGKNLLRVLRRAESVATAETSKKNFRQAATGP